MHPQLFVDFAIVIGIATVVGALLHFLKQPLVAGYIVAGVVIGMLQPLLHLSISHGPLEYLPDIGVALLLFLIGLELDFRELKLIGKSIVLASVAQMAVTTCIAAVLMTMFHFTPQAAVFIGLALSFSSTIVVIKLLVDKQEITTLHGKVAIGMLIVEDIFAVLALMFISLSSTFTTLGVPNAFSVVALLVKGIVLLAIVAAVIKYVIPKLFPLLAGNQELLFLSAIAWCFLFITISSLLGFSSEIGAFLGGLSLASSQFRYQIGGRLKPLRDFFIAIFFVDLGMTVVLPEVIRQLPAIALFTFYALIIKPFEILGILSALRFRKYTTFHTAIVLSQVSEFSVILLVAAARNHFVDPEIVQVMTTTTIVTIFVSSLVVNQSHRIYPLFAKALALIERKQNGRQQLLHQDLTNHIVLVGADRAGEPVFAFLKERALEKLLVVDYNPHIIQVLEASGVRVLFGDISDPDILDQLNLGKAAFVISTIRELKDNLLLLQTIKNRTSKAIVIMAASNDADAEILYRHGAHEVVVPLTLEGTKIVRSLSEHWANPEYYYEHRKKYLDSTVV